MSLPLDDRDHRDLLPPIRPRRRLPHVIVALALLGWLVCGAPMIAILIVQLLGWLP